MTKAPKGKGVWRKRIKHIVLALILGIMSITVAGALYIHMNLRSLPKVDAQYLQTYDTTKILDDKGQVIWQPTDKHVGIMKSNEIPSLYKKTLIAVEDGNYWHNHGYSMKGIAHMIFSVVYSKINHNCVARGGSTIEQQLIKNVYFNGGNGIKTTTRKIQEIYLARQLDSNFSKKQILAYYVNNLSFAEGDTGISAVMMTYFGKKPSDYSQRTIANIAEQAYLAGLGQNPTTYNLYTNPKLGEARMRVVLGVMKEHHYITNDEYKQAYKYDLRQGLKPRYWQDQEQQKLNLKYKSYTDAVRGRLGKMGYNLKDVSLTVHTYLNQEQYDKITDIARQNQYYQDGSKGQEQVGVTVIDHDGIVRGMVGSRNSDDELNRAVQRTRSSGSSLKPFTAYGPMLQYLGNKYNSGSVFDSGNYRYPGTDKYMHNWGHYTYGNISAQAALWKSLNTVVARIDDHLLGSNRMKAFLHGVGLDTKSYYSAIDGIGLYVSTLDAAAAWNTLNNGGIYTEPRFIKSITFTDGSTKTIKPVRVRAMNESTAWVLTQMLRGVMTNQGTAPSARIPNKNYTGYVCKTGTVGLESDSTAPDVYGSGGGDAWVDSITNGGYAVSLWFGYDKPNQSPQVADNFLGPELLTRDLQAYLNNGKNTIGNWPRPNNVKTLGGSGISTTYAITDSKDIAVNNESADVPDISKHYRNLAKVTKATAETSISSDWQKRLPESEKAFYDIYKNDHSVLDDPSVLNSNVFDTLKKGAQ